MIALIDYRAGNLTSVRKAITHLGGSLFTPTLPEDLADASAIVVPGVGNFEATKALDENWTRVLREKIDRGTPVLGICLGLQWLFDGSDEANGISGLGMMPGTCSLIKGFTQKNGKEPLKVPHVGWNSLNFKRRSWILNGVNDGDQVYFTHSFAAPVTPDCVASTQYGVEFASIVERDHVVGVQFHPEKSSDVGLTILRNFLSKG